MTDRNDQHDRVAWRFEDPTSDFTREDWLNVAVSICLMLGVGGISAAVALRVAAVDALPSGCGTGGLILNSDSMCIDYVTTMNTYIEWTMYPGIALVVIGAVLQRRWLND